MIHLDASDKQWLLFFLCTTSPPFSSPSLLCSSEGPLHCDRCLLAFLLLGVLLLGADGGVAVLPGCHREDEVTTNTKAFPVPRLGWAVISSWPFCLLLSFYCVFSKKTPPQLLIQRKNFGVVSQFQPFTWPGLSRADLETHADIWKSIFLFWFLFLWTLTLSWIVFSNNSMSLNFLEFWNKKVHHIFNFEQPSCAGLATTLFFFLFNCVKSPAKHQLSRKMKMRVFAGTCKLRAPNADLSGSVFFCFAF